MPKYENAVVYKLCCDDPEITDIYVGSTCNFKVRKWKHKSNCTNENSNDNSNNMWKSFSSGNNNNISPCASNGHGHINKYNSNMSSRAVKWVRLKI